MSRIKTRVLVALLASGLVLAGQGAAVRADGVQAPWFEPARGADLAPASFEPVRLAFAYLPFWQYSDGFAWAHYHTLQMARQMPAIYAVRPATPLPGLPSQPESSPAPEPPPPVAANVVRPKVVEAEKTEVKVVPPPPKPAPAPEPEPAPAPQPEPAPAPKVTPGLTADEQQMVNLVNAERKKAGLPVLAADLRLVQTARVKSQDMITHNYFAHDSATLGSPFDQMRNAGIRYLTAGENIAGNQSVEAAHQALMNSSGHRANILNPRFTKIGIGIIQGGKYGLMFTQQFIGD